MNPALNTATATASPTAAPATTLSPAATPSACGWKCGDETPGHQHYAVLIRELNGRLIGRLCPDGTATNRNVYAAILSRSTAERVAADITAVGEFTARAIPF